MSPWRDMKDAPRDGSRILLGRSSRAVKRKVCIGRAIENGGYGRVWALETTSYHKESEFFGWMPLPSIYLADTWPDFVPTISHSLPTPSPGSDKAGTDSSSPSVSATLSMVLS